MPFKSEKQRKWMHANKPKMAKKWEKEEESVTEAVKDPKLKVGQKIRHKSDPRRLYILKKITHGNSGIPEDPAGTSYMFVAPGNRKEYHTKKTWAQAIKKGWIIPESVSEDRDYKDEYKKFQSSTKAKKYRAELNQYNRKKGTYGNGDGKDASHKGGKIVGFEAESKNRGRAEKSRLKKEGKEFTDSQLASRIAYHANLHKGTGVGYANAFAQIGMFLRDIGYKKSFIEAVKVMKVLAKKKRVESVNEAVDKTGIIKKQFPWAKGKMVDVIKMMIEMDTDGLAGIQKNMKKNPKAFKQFVKDVSKMRGMNESGLQYRMGVKRYGKEGMTKIQSAAGSGADHAEIGAIKDKYDKKKKKKKKESVMIAHLVDMIREELKKYEGGYSKEWNNQRKKNAEVLGYKLSGKSDIKESAVSFWQDMFRPGPIPKRYITQLIKKKGELPSKSHIKSIYKDNGNPSSSELAKSWKLLQKDKYVRAASGMWRWNADFTAWESINYDNWVNEGFEKYHLGGLLDSKLKKRLERAIKIWGGKIDAVGDDYVKFRLSSFEVQKFPALLKKLDKNKNVWIGDKRKNNIYDRKQNIDKLNEGSTIPSAGAKAHVDDGPRYWWGDRGSYESHQDKIAGKLGWEVVDWIMKKNTKMWGDADPRSADYPGKFDKNLYKGKDVDPGGPTGAVSYAPTGIMGKKGGTQVFQVDNMAKGFSLWEDHIKFVLKNLGWEIMDYMGAENVLMNTLPPEEHPEDTKHDRKSEKGKVTEAMIATPPAYSSSEAQKHVDRDVTIMSKFIGKASQQVIKTMMDGVKSGRYDAMDLQRGFQSGPVKRTHYGEMDFIQQLWRKVRDGFRRYSKDRKLR